MHPAPDRSRRDLTQSRITCTYSGERIAGERCGAFAIRRIALHRMGLPWASGPRGRSSGPSSAERVRQGWRTLDL